MKTAQETPTGRVTQESANYIKATPEQLEQDVRCKSCVFFQYDTSGGSNHTCQVVEGIINPDFVSDLWARGSADPEEMGEEMKTAQEENGSFQEGDTVELTRQTPDIADEEIGSKAEVVKTLPQKGIMWVKFEGEAFTRSVSDEIFKKVSSKKTSQKFKRGDRVVFQSKNAGNENINGQEGTVENATGPDMAFPDSFEVQLDGGELVNASDGELERVGSKRTAQTPLKTGDRVRVFKPKDFEFDDAEGSVVNAPEGSIPRAYEVKLDNNPERTFWFELEELEKVGKKLGTKDLKLTQIDNAIQLVVTAEKKHLPDNWREDDKFVQAIAKLVFDRCDAPVPAIMKRILGQWQFQVGDRVLVDDPQGEWEGSILRIDEESPVTLYEVMDEYMFNQLVPREKLTKVESKQAFISPGRKVRVKSTGEKGTVIQYNSADNIEIQIEGNGTKTVSELDLVTRE